MHPSTHHPSTHSSIPKNSIFPSSHKFFHSKVHCNDLQLTRLVIRLDVPEVGRHVVMDNQQAPNSGTKIVCNFIFVRSLVFLSDLVRLAQCLSQLRSASRPIVDSSYRFAAHSSWHISFYGNRTKFHRNVMHAGKLPLGCFEIDLCSLPRPKVRNV